MDGAQLCPELKRHHLGISGFSEFLAVFFKVSLHTRVLLGLQVVIDQEVEPDLQEGKSEDEVVGNQAEVRADAEAAQDEEEHQSDGHEVFEVRDVFRQKRHQVSQGVGRDEDGDHTEKWISGCHLDSRQSHGLAQENGNVGACDSHGIFHKHECQP